MKGKFSKSEVNGIETPILDLEWMNFYTPILDQLAENPPPKGGTCAYRQKWEVPPPLLRRANTAAGYCASYSQYIY